MRRGSQYVGQYRNCISNRRRNNQNSEKTIVLVLCALAFNISNISFSASPSSTEQTTILPCADARVMNYKNLEDQVVNFEVSGSDSNEEVTADAGSALLGSPGNSGWIAPSNLDTVSVVLKLAEPCAEAEVVQFGFILQGADSIRIRVGSTMSNTVSIAQVQLKSNNH